MRGKLSFLYVNVLFDMTKCKFIVKRAAYNVGYLFAYFCGGQTKIIFVYNFVATLKSTDV